ncbi:fimbrillin family protein [Parabacteroides sp. PF5-9]|uniref:fimbrillin family protein n=1 Tax=Parabacteroides sp. PF5-9 TaxID=1742404 RepID=UPI0024740235|nr:fimbrillin family protein [Parabacteroides sp. PF5-9]MDH6358755.1 hypothetical protein [Parabacteroides sp. PF5-9]
MKQKMILGLSLLAMVGLWTGCTDEEPPVAYSGTTGGGEEIAFRVQGGVPETTKTTATTADKVDAFVVYGTDNKSTSTNIFEGVTVARQVDGGFTYSPKRFYSVGAASAEFVAYSPVSAKVTNPVTTTLMTTGVTFDYEVVAPDNSEGKTTQEDLLIAATPVSSPSATAVNFAFTHALSRIFVKAKSSMKETVVIKGLTLKNLYPEGTLTGTPGTPWTWEWITSGTKTVFPYALANTGIAVPAGIGTGASPNNVPVLVTSMEQGMMVIPQKLTWDNGSTHDPAEDFYLEVTYDVANLTNQVAKINLTKDYLFEANTQYAITIEFSSSVTNLIEIGFTISVGDFANDPTTMP